VSPCKLTSLFLIVDIMFCAEMFGQSSKVGPEKAGSCIEVFTKQCYANVLYAVVLQLSITN